MVTKLTLRLNAELIKQAKVYAKKKGKSVSQIVSDYFSLLNQRNDGLAGKSKPSSSLPLTKSLRGVLKESDLSEKDYKKYLEDKYR